MKDLESERDRLRLKCHSQELELQALHEGEENSLLGFICRCSEGF